MDLRTRWNRFANARAGQVDYFTLTSAHYSLAQTLLPIIAQYASGKVLDLGAGFGAYRFILKPRGDVYVGLDVQFVNSPLDLLGDGRQLPFAANDFDFILCSQVLEHTPEPWRLLQEAYRVLRHGGIFIVSAPHISYIHAAPEDYYRYTNYGLTFLLHQAGFEQIKIQPAGGIIALLGSLPQTICLGLLPDKPSALIEAVLTANRLLSRAIVSLDKIVDRTKLLTLNFVVVAKK